MSKTVLVPIADGTEELEAVTMIDVLRRAGAEVTVASVAGLQVTASRKTKLTADILIRDCAGQRFDLIALPGGLPGAEHLRDSTELTRMLRKQAESGRWYAAICAAPVVVLKHNGLLHEKKATCHSSFVEKLSNREGAEEDVVVDGNCVTSRGPATAMAFALRLVELLYGDEKAKAVERAMV